MQTIKSVLFVINSQQYVNALILAKKLSQLAQQQGYDSAIIAVQDQLPEQDFDTVVFIGQAPSKLEAFNDYAVATISLQQAMDNAEQSLQDALSKTTTVAQLATQPNAQPQAQNFVAVTACPTGVAHTFMAAEALQQGAAKLGYRIQVETQGSVGAKNILTDEAIAAADIVILATDIEVNTDRFVGKRVYRCGTGFALKQTDKAFAEAITEAKLLESSKQNSQKTSQEANKEKTGVYKHLLTGVSFMLPMVVAGGLLIALSLCFGLNAAEQAGSLAAVLKQIGAAAFSLMVPMLAGYIAYSIADRPGLAPGLVGGLIATQLNAGFLGGIVAGFLAGYIALFLAKKIKLPTSLEALKPILIVPLLGTLSVGLIMFYVVGHPVAQIFEMMKDFLNNMGTTNAVLMGIVLASMMCIDLGGPINKAAYAFTVGLLTTNTYMPMAATMAGGMVPAIGMAIATLLAKQKFNQSERDAGKAAFVLGLCFISEGAIPFAAKDPIRVIPACIAGGAVTGALVALFHCELVTPHGGIFVLLIPNAISHAWLYLAAIAIGSGITGVIYALLKRREVVEVQTA
ncbi:fructose-specific PTS transporter subunit EIIC [Acinetobacter sp. 1000160]|uniref:fructose-specific PTS transporter subunit EIIC n=1 Tax=Acinetobacter sp. 1000160 TaxID=1310800 RepID=UPI00044A4D51|nr:fructose-specific PTS transporter subunit EIIC [Acinetobacter sp. 1000160]EXB48745.1 PTS system, Fru family, IIB component domain protein [Acinetobacter baumannii 146457]EYT22848.1 PTS system, Fru family, IIB component domain protein [Acinetobacter sp. 1000160]